MRKEKLLKIALVSIMIITLLLMTTSVFAVDGNYTLDLTNTVNTPTTNTNTPTTNTNTPTANTNTPSYNTTVPKPNNANTNLPSAGLAENTMLGIALTVLVITAIYAYRKFKYYKSI